MLPIVESISTPTRLELFERRPIHTLRISYKEAAMVATERRSVPGNLSSNPWRVNTRSHGQNRTSNVEFLVGASVLLILGGVQFKRGLEKVHRWDRQLQVDSLAYDLAYTDTRCYAGYESFISPALWDKFDRFDV
jgi:hypothetical protein